MIIQLLVLWTIWFGDLISMETDHILDKYSLFLAEFSTQSWN